MDPKLLELYSDYLLASFGQTSATRLSQLLEGAVSHVLDRTAPSGPVRGLNFITAFYVAPLEGVRYGLPIGCEVIQKVAVWNDKKACTEMKSPVTKNEHYRQLLRACVQNAVAFKYVLNDSWFSGAENMNFVVMDVKAHFVMGLKDNRRVTCCDEEDIVTWTGVLSDLPLEDTQVKAVYLTDVHFPVLVSGPAREVP